MSARSEPYRIGIVAALSEEADACFVGESVETKITPVPLRKVQSGGNDILVCTSGIGKVNAAMAATLLLVSNRCNILLVVGTAGSLRPLNRDCFWIASAIQHDYGAREEHGFVHYDAGAWPIGVASIKPLLPIDDPGLGLPHARIASGDAFIACPEHGRALAEALAVDIVDMETAAVAQVAASFGIRWAAVKATSDDADGKSSGDFQVNLQTAARIAGHAAERLIGLLTPSR